MNTISTVYDIQRSVGRPFKTRHTGAYGIEIETETERKYEYPNLHFWECKKDNSLRDWGVEYVLKGPLSIPELEKAFEEFQQADKKYKFRPESVSTSVHVHVNMLNQSYLTVANFITTWLLVEGLLIKYSGQDRLSNLFCLGVKDAEGLLDHWEKYILSLSRNNFKQCPSPETVKYSALNVSTMSNLGTLEARCFRGETDVKKIQVWIEILNKIKEFAARTDLTPIKIVDMYNRHREGIVDIIFVEYAKELKCKDYQKLITLDHLKYASKIASSCKDWSRFGVVKIKPVYKEMVKDILEQLSQEKLKHPFDQLPFHERMVIYELYQRRYPTSRIVDELEDV